MPATRYCVLKEKDGTCLIDGKHIGRLKADRPFVYEIVKSVAGGVSAGLVMAKLVARV